ncbi:MAG: tRNA pseudouridine(38-40) synthase TruA [Alphaproteobacteria bacterium]|nr:tRNA pseudouridine(38-40) synthase TruA [Alphaproteobacteria bacterium]
MSRWKITIEYDGTGFCGWQRQAHDAVSVQQVLEDAVRKFSGEEVTLHAAGRTDAGVHARGQVAHFDLIKTTDADTVRDAVNAHTRPHKVVVLKAEAVTEDFHARFSAQARSYRYTIANRRAPLAIGADYAWHVPKPLALAPMQEAATLLIGHHDFSTFRAQHCQSNSPLKTLDALDITAEAENILFYARAKSFLYHQVRNMVGTLVMVGNGQWTLEDFKSAFAARDRTKGGPTAPPQGLCFWEVFY